MSERIEISRPMAVPGPAAFEAMCRILHAGSQRDASYGDFALSIGLPNGIPSSTNSISIPVTLTNHLQPQRYENEVRIAATSAPAFFPTFEGSLSISLLRDAGCELWMQGDYAVPLGNVGELIDATLLRRAARSSLEGFLAWLGARIEERIATDAVDA